MRTTTLGPLANISRLTLGGGGLGQIWGETTAQEAVATLHAATAARITLIDAAPMYHNCEAFIGEAFAGVLPADVRITSKCWLGTPDVGTAAQRLEASLDASLQAMRLQRVDVFLLHNNLCEDDTVFSIGNDRRREFATPWSLYVAEVAPAMAELKRQGRIGAWGITGVGLPDTIIKAMGHDVRPDVVQVVTNLMDSPGGLRRYAEPPCPRDIIAAAKTNAVGVMGIRAVQAGALTAGIDRSMKDSHPEAADFRRAAPWRALCAELGHDPAVLAHRYALDLAGVDTVVLGVKNRAELTQCLEAETAGPLEPALRARIDALGLASQPPA